MKIDDLINSLGGGDSMIITNKSAIESIFDELPKEDENTGTFKIERQDGITRTVCRGGTTIWFIDEAGIDLTKFADLIIEQRNKNKAIK